MTTINKNAIIAEYIGIFISKINWIPNFFNILQGLFEKSGVLYINPEAVILFLKGFCSTDLTELLLVLTVLGQKKAFPLF